MVLKLVGWNWDMRVAGYTRVDPVDSSCLPR